MSSMSATTSLGKRKAESEASRDDHHPKAAKLIIQKSLSTDPEDHQAPMQGRRVLYPEGPPSVSDDSILDDPEILGLLRTEWNDGEINAFRKRFKTLTRQPLRERDLKPPSGQWGSEDPATAGLWKHHFATRKPKEPRNKKGNQLAKEVIVIQPGDYHEVTPGVDTILYDELDGSVAGVVIWDFIKDGSVPGTVGHGLVDYIDETICNQGRMLRNSRRDDGGIMVQLGYTSARNIEKKQKTKGGDQAKAEDFTGDNVKSSETRAAEVVSLPVENLQIQSDDKGKASLPLVPDSTSEAKSTFFDWSRSLTSKVHSTGELRGYVHEATSIQSLLWTAYQKVLPSEITDDFRDTMECHGLPRMDWNMKGKPVKSAISVKANGTKYNLSGFELGPPSALAGMNYSKVTHKESNANNYVISYTTNRTVGEDEGRHFLFVKYGVKVPVRRNTLVVHRPTDPHGTTLPHRSPKEELDRSLESQQSGMGMLISNSLLNAWRKFKGETKEVFEAKKQELQKTRDAKSTLGGVREGSDSEETSDIEEEEEPL